MSDDRPTSEGKSDICNDVPSKPRGMLPGAIGVATGIFILLCTAVAQRDRIIVLISQVFGPPVVQVQEAYDNISTATFDHSKFNRLLGAYVDGGGWVDYAGVRTVIVELDAYIVELGTAPFADLGRDEKLAFLINAYNAFTLKLILDHYPLDSIKDIPKSRSWDDVRWSIAGETYSLNQIEHEQIRPKFREPRIHFSLVCAAVGCPPLRNEAFSGDQLEKQLADQTDFVHTNKTWFQFNQAVNIVKLTKLYQWYGGDFKQVGGDVLNYASDYSTELKQALNSGASPTMDWLDYDWKLNSIQNRAPR